MHLYFAQNADADWDNVLNWWSNSDCNIAAGVKPTTNDDVTVVTAWDTGPLAAITLHSFFSALGVNPGANTTNLTIAEGGSLVLEDGSWYGDADEAATITIGENVSNYGVLPGLTATTGFINFAVVNGDVVMMDGATNGGTINGNVSVVGMSTYPTGGSGDGTINGNLQVEESGAAIACFTTMVSGTIKYYSAVPSDFMGGGTVQIFTQLSGPILYSEATLKPMVKDTYIQVLTGAYHTVDTTGLNIPDPASVVAPATVSTTAANSVIGAYNPQRKVARGGLGLGL